MSKSHKSDLSDMSTYSDSFESDETSTTDDDEEEEEEDELDDSKSSSLDTSKDNFDETTLYEYSSVFFKTDSNLSKINSDHPKPIVPKINQKITEKTVSNKTKADSTSLNELNLKTRVFKEPEQKQNRPLTSIISTNSNLNRVKSHVGTSLRNIRRPMTTKMNSETEQLKQNDFQNLSKKPPLPKPQSQSTIDLKQTDSKPSKTILTSKTKITVDTSKARSNTEVLKLCIMELGWQECPDGLPNGCDIIWQSFASHEGRDQKQNTNSTSDSRLNKFPSMNNLLKKGPLTHTLNVMRQLYPDDYNFYPRTWFLPEQLKEFTQDCRYIHDQDLKMNRTLTTFIVKPNDGSQGDGIYLINSPSGYLNSKTENPKGFIVQEYVHNPFLIDGLKSDFRIYVVILNIKPLEIYICDEGLVRFATVDYQEPNEKNLDQVYMHLTNYSLNKKNVQYQFCGEEQVPEREENSNKLSGHGSKRKLTKIFNYMSKIGLNVTKIKNDIDDLVIKTVFALLPEIKVELNYEIMNSPNKQRPSSFQIIGFDILLKEDLKPVLLEVNCNPSLRIDFESETPDGQIITLPSPIDVEIKKPLVLETLRLACPKKKLEQIEKLKKEEELVQRSALYRQNLVKHRIEQRSLSSIKSKKINFNKMPLLSKPSESYIKKLKASTSNTPDLKSLNLNQKESSESTTSILTSNFLNYSSTIISSNNSSTSSSKTSQCLRNIFPNNNLRRQYNHLFIQDNIADLFIFFTMYNNYKLMTHGEFRLFVKSCNISNRQLSSDNLDIIFYDLSKKWDMYNTKKRFYDEEQNPIIGLCYQGFVECFIKLSRLIFTNEQTLEQCVRSFISYCKIILLQKGFKTSQFYSLDLNKIENNFLYSKLDNLKLRLIKRNEYQTSDFESPTNLLKTKKSIFPIFFDTMA